MLVGPHIPNSLKYGRKDCSEKEAASFKGKSPNPEEGVSAFKDAFLKKGFTDKDIVALSTIYTVDSIQHPNQKLRSNFPLFDNYLFQTVKRGERNHPIQKVLGDDSFKETVELFANNKTEYIETF